MALVEDENEEDQYVASQAAQNNIVQNSKSKDMKIVHGCKQHAGTEKEQDASNKQPFYKQCSQYSK